MEECIHGPQSDEMASLHDHLEKFRGSGVLAATEARKDPMRGNTKSDFWEFFFISISVKISAGRIRHY